MKSQAKSLRTTALKRNTLSFRHVIAMAMAFMSPAAAIFFNTIPQAGLVGAAIPLCYGISDIGKFAQDAAPFDTIARQYWGGSLVLLINLAGVVSLYAMAVAAANGAARILYAISREGLFPRWLAQVHPTHRTPTNAILGLCGLTLVVGIGIGTWLTPVPAFSLLGSVGALTALMIYTL